MPELLHSHIFLDESGDLGWSFKAPYRSPGGSSRFLTIGFLVTPVQQLPIARRIVRDVYHKFNFPRNQEVKSSDLKPVHREFICRETIKMLEKYPHFVLGTTTVKKENVPMPIRQDSNLLYNFMIGQCIFDHIDSHQTCKLTRDNRTVKMLSGSSCIDYLQTMLFLHLEKQTILKDNPTHSHQEDGVIFIDWITGIVWSKYEDKVEKWCELLGNHIKEKHLFF